MPTFAFRGVTVHYLDYGQGEPVLLLHAGASSGRQWQKIGGFLQDRCRLVAPDLLGFGDTPSWPGPDALSHDHQADLAATLLRTVCDGAVHVVGHSYGGSTAVRLIAAAPERVKRLVLIEPNLVPLLREAGDIEIFDEYRRFAEGFMEDASAGRDEAAWESFIDLRNGAGTWRAMPDKVRGRFLGLTQQTVDGFKSNLSNPATLADCRAIAVPTLIVCGGNTTRPERRITEILAKTISCCRYEIIPDAEHMSPLTHPAEVASLILDHLAPPTYEA